MDAVPGDASFDDEVLLEAITPKERRCALTQHSATVMLWLRPYLETLTEFCDHLRGPRTTRLEGFNNHPKEAYHIVTDNGNLTLYCTEYLYSVRFERWWVPNQLHHVYRVYGVCDPSLPKDFAETVTRGFHIGRLLPRTASRAAQKKAAIQAYINMVLGELRAMRQNNEQR